MPTIDELFLMPGMFIYQLSPTFNSFSLGSFAANFLFGLFDLESQYHVYEAPGTIQFELLGDFLSVSAKGWKVIGAVEDIDSALETFNAANWYQHLQEHQGHVLSYWRSIVWFSEYCLLSLPSGQYVYTQGFGGGRPVSSSFSRRPAGSATPEIVLIASMPKDRPTIFDPNPFKLSDLQVAYQSWRKSRREYARRCRSRATPDPTNSDRGRLTIYVSK
jgi:hypothetical protein